MQSITHFIKIISLGVKRDMRVRWGLGAGASVLLSAGVLGMGGLPVSLHASSTAPHALLAQASTKVEVIDMGTSTVAQIIDTLPQAERYSLMLYNGDAQWAFNQGGEYTVFVPASNDFDYLPAGTIAALTRAQMQTLALSHIVDSALPMDESLNGDVITMGGTSVSFKVDAAAQTASVGDAQVLKAYKAQNGMVYLIDKVLLPGGN